MIKVQDIEELQKVSDYRLLRKSLKGAAIGSIIFGVIAIGMGLAFMSEDPINVVLVFIGVFLLVEGIWLIRSPSPRGMIVDGIALCILGIWNIFIAIAGELRGFVVLGFFQIIWGVQSFRRYRRFSGISSQKPSKESLRQVDDVAKSVTKANQVSLRISLSFKWKINRGKVSLLRMLESLLTQPVTRLSLLVEVKWALLLEAR